DRFPCPSPLCRHLHPAALRPHVRSQLLDGPRRLHRSRLDLTELRQAFSESHLRTSSFPLPAYRRRRNSPFFAARLSRRLLHVFPRWHSQRPSLPTRDRSPVGQLSRPRLRVEDHPRLRRSSQRLPTIPSHHPRTRQLLPLQPLRRCSHAHAHL